MLSASGNDLFTSAFDSLKLQNKTEQIIEKNRVDRS